MLPLTTFLVKGWPAQLPSVRGRLNVRTEGRRRHILWVTLVSLKRMPRLRARFRRGGIALSTLAICAACHYSRPTDVRPSFCIPAGPGEEFQPTQWDSGSASGDGGAKLNTDRVTRLLSGTWDMLTVTTEGAAPAWVERWTLRMVAADSIAKATCFLGPCRSDPRIAAVGSRIERGKAFDSTFISHSARAPERIVAHYDSMTSHLTLVFGPPVLDAGISYTVTELSDTTMTGRWADGSYIVIAVRRGEVTTLEHPQGFFCGRRIS